MREIWFLESYLVIIRFPNGTSLKFAIKNSLCAEQANRGIAAKEVLLWWPVCTSH